jgi:hypothetical protein
MPPGRRLRGGGDVYIHSWVRGLEGGRFIQHSQFLPWKEGLLLHLLTPVLKRRHTNLHNDILLAVPKSRSISNVISRKSDQWSNQTQWGIIASNILQMTLSRYPEHPQSFNPTPVRSASGDEFHSPKSQPGAGMSFAIDGPASMWQAPPSPSPPRSVETGAVQAMGGRGKVNH